MSKVLIEIPERDLQRLDALKEVRRASRSELIRQAIGGYLDSNAINQGDEAFGLWRDAPDGLSYQCQLREEWS